MPHPLLSVLLVLAVLCLLLGVLTLFRRLCRPHPELPRKLLHVGMGSVLLALPWIFDTVWAALLLAGLGMVLLASLRVVPLLKVGPGQVLHGVGRFTLGEFYFVVAAAVLWTLYMLAPAGTPERRLFLYLVPLLLLTFADSVAALVGVYWGRRSVGRSAEGSLAFFVCAVSCILVPLLLLPDQPGATSVLLALFVGGVLTLVEATAASGLDNLVVPLLAYALLGLHWAVPAAWLAPLGTATLVGWLGWSLATWRGGFPPLT